MTRTGELVTPDPEHRAETFFEENSPVQAAGFYALFLESLELGGHDQEKQIINAFTGGAARLISRDPKRGHALIEAVLDTGADSHKAGELTPILGAVMPSLGDAVVERVFGGSASELVDFIEGLEPSVKTARRHTSIDILSVANFALRAAARLEGQGSHK